MVISEDIIRNIKDKIGISKTSKAEEAYKNNRVKIESIDLNWNYEIVTILGYVDDNSYLRHHVQVRLGLGIDGMIYVHNCTCHPYSYRDCEHVLAILLEFNNNEKYAEKIKNVIEEQRLAEEKRMFNNIINKFKEDEESFANTRFIVEDDLASSLKTNIDIIPIIKLNRYGEYEISFKIGENKMYKIKSLEEFYKAYSTESIYRYGEHLVFKHTEENFNRSCKEILNFILKYGQSIHFGNLALENKRTYDASKIPSSSLLLKDKVVEEFFSMLKNKPSMVEMNGKKTIFNFKTGEENISFILKQKDNGLYKLLINNEKLVVLNGAKTIYVVSDTDIYEYDKTKYEDVFKLYSLFISKDKTEFTFEEKELIDFINNVMPRIKNNIILDNLPEFIVKKYIPKNLGVKVYLDLTEKGDILATVKFCYNEVEFEALSSNVPQIPRNMAEEKRVVNRFFYDGFSYSRNYESFIMTDEDKIYNFIMNSINYYMENYEVLISEEFKKREIRQPKITTLGVRIENDLLNIDLSGLDFDPKELKGILQKYKLKKKYHRLKDGAFLSLEQNRDLDFIDDLTEGMDIDYNSLSKGKIKIPVNRSLYLNKLLDNMKNVEITQDKQFKEIISNTENGKVDEDILIPEELEATLRPYQKTGYKWLKVLDRYKFGGILADDMGLRKDIASNNTYVRK